MRILFFKTLFLFGFGISGISYLFAQNVPSLLPLPETIVWGSGYASIPQTFTVFVGDPQKTDKAVECLKASGLVKLTPTKSPEGAFLRIMQGSGGGYPEGYSLSVGATGITITADREAGAFYGVQTLLQILEQVKRNGQDRIPFVEIQDRPRFAWRGMHLDVSRHFRSVEFIKKYLDAMAKFKLNTFHWHLTDDQGWRIEIKKYPKLTQVGATRQGTLIGHWNDQPHRFDNKKHEGFYTQAQIREIVAYAAARCITVVPEIELPGHATAALFAYPEFSCDQHRPTEVAKLWGVFNGVFKPSDATFRFIEEVLGEVAGLFPGPFIHIGGDEVPKEPWSQCPSTQAFLQENGIPETGVQRYFIARVAKMLAALDKKPIGWDEILEEGLTPDAAIMSWRGESGGIAAAKAGHNVVMTPGFALYFDHYQGPKENEPLAIGGMTTLSEVYAYDPVPESLNPGEALRILGAQGNVWTEYMPTEEQVEYMAFPRALALAEITWSPRQNRVFDDFMGRLAPHLQTLDGLKVRYRVPEPTGVENMAYAVMGGYRKLPLQAPVARAKVMLQQKGAKTPPLTAGNPHIFNLEFGQQIVYQAYTQTEGGRTSPPVTFSLTYRNPLKSAAPAVEPVPGAQVSLYDGPFSAVRGIASAPELHTGFLPRFEYPGETSPTGNPYVDFVNRLTAGAPRPVAPKKFLEIGLQYKGLLRIETSGIYTVSLGSDDGSLLRIGDDWVLDNDGLHGYEIRKSEIALDPGYHPFLLFYFNAGGDGKLDLRWTGPDGVAKPIVPYRAP
jgi:hexosaminidase